MSSRRNRPEGRANTNLDVRGNSLYKIFTQGSTGTCGPMKSATRKSPIPSSSPAACKETAPVGCWPPDSDGRGDLLWLQHQFAVSQRRGPAYRRPAADQHSTGWLRATHAHFRPRQHQRPGCDGHLRSEHHAPPAGHDEAGNATQLAYDGNQNLTGVQAALGAQPVNVNLATLPPGHCPA